MTHGFDQMCPTCDGYFDTILQQKRHARLTGHVELAYCASPRTSGPRCRHHCGRQPFHPGSCGVDTSHGKLFWESPLQKALRPVLKKAMIVWPKAPTISAWMVAQAAYKFGKQLGYPVETDDWVVETNVDDFREIAKQGGSSR